MPAKNVETRGVCKRFGAVEAVQPLDLKVDAGEFLTLLGPSGCGKTTLLRMIAGLEQVSQGTILVGGVDVTAVPPKMRDTSIMFQDYALFPHKSVIDNIAYGLKMRGLQRHKRNTKAAEWLQRINLSEFGNRLPHQLSGGQRQRVALARALIMEPGVLLLDEPLGALDASLRQQLQGELRRLHKDVGITFIAVTHDQEEAITMSDRIAVMREGKIEQLGSPQMVYDRPHTEFVARFLGRCNIIDGIVVSSNGSKHAIETSALGRIIATGRTTFAAGAPVKLAVRPESVLFSNDGFESRLLDITFLGSACRITLSTQAGVIIECEAKRDTLQVKTGDRIGLTVTPDAATIIKDTP